MKKIIISFIVFSLFFSVFTFFYPIKTCSATETLHVGSGQEYPTIQAAVNAANASDTIYVHSGTYNENIIIDKSLTLTGEGSSNTIISGSGDHTVQVTLTSNVAISGFKIQNTGGDKACIFLSSVSGCTISSNIIRNGGNGIYLVSSNGNTIQDNTIQENNVGIYFSNSDNNEIRSNNIDNNNANGIFLSSTSTGNTFYLNDFSDNTGNNARDLGSNDWSYSSQGNYWDDYNDYDANNDGIGDSAYAIEGGSQDSFPLGYFLNEDPVAYIDSVSPNPATEGQQVSFNGRGTDDGTIMDWEWISSINGKFGSSEDVIYSGLSVGTHTIKFRVEDDNNQWSAYAQDTLVVNSQSGGGTGAQNPTASITKPSSTLTEIQGNSVEFRGYGIPSEGMILEYAWTSNLDGEISSLSSFTKNDLSVGTHSISFKVRDSNGWSDTDTVTVIIQQGTNSGTNTPPTVSTGGPYTGSVGVPITFDGSGCSDDDGDEITSYQWSFGDEVTGTGMVPTHTYSESGTYIITLTISDGTDTNTDATTAIISSDDEDNGENGNDSGDGDGNDTDNGNTNDDDTINDDDSDTNDDESEDESPGFIFIFILIAIILIAIIKKKSS